MNEKEIFKKLAAIFEEAADYRIEETEFRLDLDGNTTEVEISREPTKKELMEFISTLLKIM